MQGTVLTVVVRTGDDDLVPLLGGGDRGRDLLGQGPLGSLDLDALAVDGDGDVGGDGHGGLTDT